MEKKNYSIVCIGIVVPVYGLWLFERRSTSDRKE